MKHLLIILTSILLFTSCENQKKQEATSKEVDSEVYAGDVYGEAIKKNNIQPATKLKSLVGKSDVKELRLMGNINAVCQGSGCWIDMDMGNGETVHITFKDEAFTLPKDIGGKTAVIDGIALTEVVSVDMQKKIAKEDGLSQEEIDAIKEPLIEYYFEASGVTVDPKLK